MTATTNERVVFSSRRGGSGTGRGVYVVFGVLLFWFPLVGALTDVVENAAGRVGVELLWLVALGAVATLLFGWIALFVGPICVVTDRRFVGRRYLRPRVDVPAAELAGAQRVVVQIRRGMEVVREQHTHLVAVVLRSGRVVRVGPVRDAEGLVALVRQIGSGEVDPRALRGVAGEPSRAEERGDLFFATQAATGGAPRGPLFVGPTAVVGFAARLSGALRDSLLTIVGAERAPEDVEQSVVGIARAAQFGPAVVLEREGADVRVDGARLVVTSARGAAAFDLARADAERAARYLAQRPHAYR